MLKIWFRKGRESLCTPVIKTSLISHTLCFELCLTKNKLGDTVHRIARSTKTYGSRNTEPTVPKAFTHFPIPSDKFLLVSD